MMFRDTKAFLGFSVDNVEKAKQFYSQTLGLNVSEQGGLLHLHLAGSSPVLVYPKPNHEPATFTILNFPVDNIETAMDELAGRGVKFEHYDLPQVKTDAKGVFTVEGALKQAWFKDPAGNILSVIQEL
jgi:catechol 2,3-dioxygenase-like lactoylglutathione lyase family enzyme